MASLTRTKYEANEGSIHKIRMGSDEAAQAGAPPAGVVTSDITVKISKNDREFGIKPRGVSLYRSLGTLDEREFLVYKFLPVLTPTAWAGATYAPNAEITIGTEEWTVIKRVAENAD